ncbi:hypothetical protein [Actinoplanes aureus]|nr:hypothetical protein [Actinoplanes aureus]
MSFNQVSGKLMMDSEQLSPIVQQALELDPPPLIAPSDDVGQHDE